MSNWPTKPPLERFEKKFQMVTESGCWIWDAALIDKKQGYGSFYLGNGQHEKAHRASWMLYKGEIPVGFCVLHRCDVRACVNPNHLFLGTNKDNVDDRVKKGRTRVGFGEKHGNSKLNNEKVLMMRAMYADGSTSYELAEIFGCGKSMAHLVCSHRNWKHVGGAARVTP
jgi:hypothetical protein